MDDITVVIPHGGGAERLRNLRAVVARLRQEAVRSVIVVEMDARPAARADVQAAGYRYVFAEQDTTFHKTRAMNVAIPMVATPIFLWLDGDIPVTARFLRDARRELRERGLDCLVPYTRVRYLAADETEGVLAGTLDPAACTRSSFQYASEGLRGGAVLVRTGFVKRWGGMCEEFHGWGGEDNAFYDRAGVLGRAGVTQRRGVELYHFHHPPREWEHNPHHAKNMDLLREIRELCTPEAMLRRFPVPAHCSPPWVGTRRVACAPGAEAVGRALVELYGPAVTLCAAGEHPHAVARADPSCTAYEAAIELARGLTLPSGAAPVSPWAAGAGPAIPGPEAAEARALGRRRAFATVGQRDSARLRTSRPGTRKGVSFPIRRIRTARRRVAGHAEEVGGVPPQLGDAGDTGQLHRDA